MSRYSYSKSEQEINNVLAYQSDELAALEKKNQLASESLEKSIASSEKLLQELGYDLPKGKGQAAGNRQKETIVIPPWEELAAEAKAQVGTSCTPEDLFTTEELKANEEAVRLINQEYDSLHKLDKYDIMIAALGAMLGAAVDIVWIGIPAKGPDGLEAGKLSEFVRQKMAAVFVPEDMEKLAGSNMSKVPYDAQDNRNTNIYVKGLSAYYHRMLSLGHDPVLGFIFGVYDILHGTMTTIDKDGKIVCQVMDCYSGRRETEVILAILKQLCHLKSDITTSMGLPAPLMSLFNLLQFGNIGEENQTIAEIVQGMYYEGFDLIHFCSQSVSVIILELTVRIGYAVKRIREGRPVKDSIPVSLNRDRHPKLASMLFIAHCGSTAINAGKICFTRNPLAINYPQWTAFAEYAYKQLKSAMIEKPEARKKYVQKVLKEELMDVIREENRVIEEYGKGYRFIFE